MEKRYQVFVSSTYEDLKEERRQVTQALLELECLPAAMELFVATDDDQWTLITEVIDLSDYYVVIVGGRYGSTTAEGISYTEKEFNYALESGKPVLAFVHGNPEAIPQGKTDMDDQARARLDAFRERVMTDRTVARFNSAHELGSEVSRALTRLMRRKPGTGWVRGDMAMTLEQERELLSLREQIAELRVQKVAADSALVEDVAELAQGSEKITLTVISETRYSNQNYNYSTPVVTTWDNVFADIAALMVDEASEQDVSDRLATHLYYWADEDERSRLDAIEYKRLTVPYDDWDMVRVQFDALGLTDKGTKKRAVQDGSSYLRLTDKGRRHLTALRAVRTGTDPGRTDADADETNA